MGNYISFAKFNNKHLYIISSIILLIIKNISFGYNYNDSFKPLFHEQTYGSSSNHYLIRNILCYIVTFILSLFLYKIESKNSGRLTLNKIDYEENSSFNQIHPDSNDSFFNGVNLKLIFIIFIWILDENLIQFFIFLKDLDFWMVEIIIISYITSVMLKTKIYLHHKIVINLNIIPVIFKIITIFISFHDDCNKSNNDYYYCYNYNYTLNGFNMCLSRNETNSFYNKTGIKLNDNLKNYYVLNPYFVPIGIMIYISFITLRSYANSSIKYLMDLKYISEKKLLMLYGLIGTIISFIFCIITTFVKCKDVEDKSNIYDYICKVKYNEKLYFDNFKAVHQTLTNKYSLTIILKTIIGVICFYFNKYISMLIIKYFTPVHLIFSVPVLYFTQKTILSISTLIQEQQFFSINRRNYIETKFSLDIAGDIISSIGFLVYLEIIELNFCSLNYNLKRKIADRADDEKYENLGIEKEDENNIKMGNLSLD